MTLGAKYTYKIFIDNDLIVSGGLDICYLFVRGLWTQGWCPLC